MNIQPRPDGQHDKPKRNVSTRLSRRSFLGSTATAMFAAHSIINRAHSAEVIPGFDQTSTDYDKTKAWKPFSDRKVRVGLVGYGVCQFSAAFEFQNHPNVEVVAVSDLIPDRCAALAKRVNCQKTYPSLEEMVKDDRIEAIFVATDAPSHTRHCIEVLNHGKHVCTAVPAFYGDIEDAERLLECVKKNRGLVYAMFETSVFHDDLYAMEKLYAAGVFGRIVYSEAVREGGGEGLEVEGQFVRHPGVQLPPLGCILHELVKDRRLDVREDDPVEKFEDPPLDEGRPVHPDPPFLRFVPGYDPGHDHLVGLFSQFAEGGGVGVIVPPLHARGGEDQFNKAAGDHEDLLPLRWPRGAEFFISSVLYPL